MNLDGLRYTGIITPNDPYNLRGYQAFRYETEKSSVKRQWLCATAVLFSLGLALIHNNTRSTLIDGEHRVKKIRPLNFNSIDFVEVNKFALKNPKDRKANQAAFIFTTEKVMQLAEQKISGLHSEVIEWEKVIPLCERFSRALNPSVQEEKSKLFRLQMYKTEISRPEFRPVEPKDKPSIEAMIPDRNIQEILVSILASKVSKEDKKELIEKLVDSRCSSMCSWTSVENARYVRQWRQRHDI